MSNNNQPMYAPNAPNDLPPPYSVATAPQYGFAVSSNEYIPPASNTAPNIKQFTPTGVYPHPSMMQPHSQMPNSNAAPCVTVPVPVGIVMPMALGTEPATVTCFNCNKTVTSRVNYSTAWHTHLAAASICTITMICSLCCLGLIPYCFDSFKEAEHYCPECNAFIGKSNKC